MWTENRQHYTVYELVSWEHRSIANLLVLYRISTVRCLDLDFDFSLFFFLNVCYGCWLFHIFFRKFCTKVKCWFKIPIRSQCWLIEVPLQCENLSFRHTVHCTYCMHFVESWRNAPQLGDKLWCPTSNCNSQSNPESEGGKKSHIFYELLSHTAFWCSDTNTTCYKVVSWCTVGLFYTSTILKMFLLLSGSEKAKLIRKLQKKISCPKFWKIDEWNDRRCGRQRLAFLLWLLCIFDVQVISVRSWHRRFHIEKTSADLDMLKLCMYDIVWCICVF